jgi:hypothetical protein
VRSSESVINSHVAPISKGHNIIDTVEPEIQTYSYEKIKRCFMRYSGDWHKISRTSSHMFQLVGTFFQPDCIKDLVSNTWHHTPVVFYFDKNNAVDKNAIAVVLYNYDQEKFYVAGYIAKADQDRFLTKVEFCHDSNFDLPSLQYPEHRESAFTNLYRMSIPSVTKVTKQTASNYVFFGNLIRHKSGYGKDSVSVSVIPPSYVSPILVGDDVHSNFYRGNGGTCATVKPETEQKFKSIYDNPVKCKDNYNISFEDDYYSDEDNEW